MMHERFRPDCVAAVAKRGNMLDRPNALDAAQLCRKLRRFMFNLFD
jgi:hypothetical protein